MSKRHDPITPEEGAALLGGSLLDRIGQPRPSAEATQRHSGVEPQRQSDSASRPSHVKISVYLPADDVDALDELLLKIRREQKLRLDRSALIRKAITHLLAAERQSDKELKR